MSDDGIHIFWFELDFDLQALLALLIVQLQFIITEVLDYKSFMQLYHKNSHCMITFCLIKSWVTTCFSMLIHH